MCTARLKKVLCDSTPSLAGFTVQKKSSPFFFRGTLVFGEIPSQRSTEMCIHNSVYFLCFKDLIIEEAGDGV